MVTTGAEASSAVVRLVSLSTEQAERLVSEATAEATEIRDDATSSAQELTGDAQARADRITTDAQEAADRVQAEARSRADSLDTEIAGRRSELLDGLNAERDELQIAVGRLRSFEASFRANLVDELQGHISCTGGRHMPQPAEVPALAEPAAVAEAERRAVESSAPPTPSRPTRSPPMPVSTARPTTPPVSRLGGGRRLRVPGRRPDRRRGPPTGPARRLGWTRCSATSAEGPTTRLTGVQVAIG